MKKKKKRLCTSDLEAMSLIFGLGAKIPHAMWHGQIKKKTPVKNGYLYGYN